MSTGCQKVRQTDRKIDRGIRQTDRGTRQRDRQNDRAAWHLKRLFRCHAALSL